MSGKLSFNLFHFTQHGLERKSEDPFWPTLILIRKVLFPENPFVAGGQYGPDDLVFRGISPLERRWAIKTKLVFCLRKSM